MEVAQIDNCIVQILLRKGGIREQGFEVKAQEFALMPTSFHSDQQLLADDVHEMYAEVRHEEAALPYACMVVLFNHACWQDLALTPKSMPEIPIKCTCKATAAWSISDAECLNPLRDLHIYTAEFLRQRMKWRPGQKLTLLEVAATPYIDPVYVQNLQRYWGCFSWTSIDNKQLMSDQKAGAAIDARVFAAAQTKLRRVLQGADQLF